MLLFRAADRSLGFVSTIILARLLVPTDFGLVAMAMSVIAIVELINSFGFEMALIQHSEPSNEHYHTAWTLQLALSLVCAALAALAAYPTASFFSEPRLAPVMLVLAGSWATNGLVNIGIVNFRRRMEFQREFAYLASRRLVGFLVTLTIAYLWQTYWALVVGVVVTRISSVFLSYLMEPSRPRLSLAKWRELVGFSKWLLAQNLITVGVMRFPHLLVGRLLGAQPLGLFTVGYDMGSLAVTELSAPVNRAVFPAYSRLGSDRERMKASYLEVGSAVLLVALPASLGIALVADPAVRLLLGSSWEGAIPIVEVSALAAACMAAAGNNGISWLALGVPRMSATIPMVRLVVLVPLAGYLVIDHGGVGVAVADLVASGACLVMSFPLLWKRLRVSLWDYVLNAWRPIVASLAMAAAVHFVNEQLTALPDTGASAFTHLVSAIACGVLVYSISLCGLWWLAGKPAGPEASAMERLSMTIGKIAAKFS